MRTLPRTDEPGCSNFGIGNRACTLPSGHGDVCVFAPLPLDSRMALRIEEAAELVGFSVRAFRDHFLDDPRCPRFRKGRTIRIPSGLFLRYLEDLAQRESDPYPETDV